MHPTWHEDDTFWRTHAPHLFQQSRIDASGAEVQNLLRLTGLRGDCRVLDLPCGIGRHSVEFARLSARVTGVDRTHQFIATAKQRAAENAVDVEFIVGDMRTFVREAAYDLILNLYTSFGYFEAHEENLAVLGNFHRSLVRGGQVVLELLGREILARDFRPRDWSERDGQILLEQRTILDGFEKISNRWIVMDGDKRVEHALTHWVYGVTDLRRMLEATGFGDVRMFGSLEGTPYDNAAKRLVAIARKP
jgi:SAM-dependent methyltransferase